MLLTTYTLPIHLHLQLHLSWVKLGIAGSPTNVTCELWRKKQQKKSEQRQWKKRSRKTVEADRRRQEAEEREARLQLQEVQLTKQNSMANKIAPTMQAMMIPAMSPDDSFLLLDVVLLSVLSVLSTDTGTVALRSLAPTLPAKS